MDRHEPRRAVGFARGARAAAQRAAAALAGRLSAATGGEGMRKAWRAVALAAAGLALAGCAAALVGGAAAGGYYAGKDERSAAQIARDGAITTKVKAKLVADPTVKALEINVDTRNDVVILRGAVAQTGQRATAERLARSVAGVKGVRNELRVR